MTPYTHFNHLWQVSDPIYTFQPLLAEQWPPCTHKFQPLLAERWPLAHKFTHDSDDRIWLLLFLWARLIYILAVTAERGSFAFSCLWDWCDQKRARVSASLKGSDPLMAKLFWGVLSVMATAWELHIRTLRTATGLRSRRPDTWLGGDEASPLLGTHGWRKGDTKIPAGMSRIHQGKAIFSSHPL